MKENGNVVFVVTETSERASVKAITWGEYEAGERRRRIEDWFRSAKRLPANLLSMVREFLRQE